MTENCVIEIFLRTVHIDGSAGFSIDLDFVVVVVVFFVVVFTVVFVFVVVIVIRLIVSISSRQGVQERFNMQFHFGRISG